MLAEDGKQEIYFKVVLFKVHSKHSNRAVTLIQQSCMSSHHIANCYCKKTKHTSVLILKVEIQAIKSCETSYLQLMVLQHTVMACQCRYFPQRYNGISRTLYNQGTSGHHSDYLYTVKYLRNAFNIQCNSLLHVKCKA